MLMCTIKVKFLVNMHVSITNVTNWWFTELTIWEI